MHHSTRKCATLCNTTTEHAIKRRTYNHLTRNISIEQHPIIMNRFMHHPIPLHSVKYKTHPDHANISLLQRFCITQNAQNNTNSSNYSSSILIASLLALSTFSYSSYSVSTQVKAEQTERKQRDPHPIWQAGDHLKSKRFKKLPTFTRKEVLEHNTENSLWLTYRHGMYLLHDLYTTQNNHMNHFFSNVTIQQ